MDDTGWQRIIKEGAELLAQRPAIVYNAALLLRVINEVRLAQQKPPEQVKPLLQAALTGVHVSPADDRIRFHGIDDVEMRRGITPQSPNGDSSPFRGAQTVDKVVNGLFKWKKARKRQSNVE